MAFFAGQDGSRSSTGWRRTSRIWAGPRSPETPEDATEEPAADTQSLAHCLFTSSLSITRTNIQEPHGLKTEFPFVCHGRWRQALRAFATHYVMVWSPAHPPLVYCVFPCLLALVSGFFCCFSGRLELLRYQLTKLKSPTGIVAAIVNRTRVTSNTIIVALQHCLPAHIGARQTAYWLMALWGKILIWKKNQFLGVLDFW